MPPAIDLNVDLGESDTSRPSARELALLAAATSINLSCGLHAGNPCLLLHLLRRATGLGVAVGAHPSYDDRPGFGRRETGDAPETIAALVADQIETLATLAARAGCTLRYIKPHGALYHRVASDPAAAHALVNAARQAADGALPVLGPAGSALEVAAREGGVGFHAEGYLDRGYRADGTLVPRGEPGAVLTDPADAIARALAFARGEPLRCTDGSDLRIRVESICVHGDSAAALDLLTAARAALMEHGVTLRPFAP